MMSNHLSKKQHRIIGKKIMLKNVSLLNWKFKGLDPAKPVIQNHGSQAFR